MQEFQKKKPQLCEAGEGVQKEEESGKWFKEVTPIWTSQKYFIYIYLRQKEISNVFLMEWSRDEHAIWLSRLEVFCQGADHFYLSTCYFHR